jgi:ATP-dependent Clp protease protease subunit
MSEETTVIDSNEEVSLPQPKKRDLFFTKQVDQDSIAALTESILAIEKHDKYIKKLYSLHNLEYSPRPINIYIDSYGGMVYQCFGLLSIMRESSTPIHTIVTGTAMSCGFLIAISGHVRSCYADSTHMYHQVSTGIIGTLKEVETEFLEASRLQDRIEDITLRQTKITPQKLEEIYNMRHDFYMSCEEALALGCVDNIIGTIHTPKTKKPVTRKKKEA